MATGDSRIVDTKYPTTSNFCNLSGRRFGCLTVNQYAGHAVNKHCLYWCTCDCGATRLAGAPCLLSGKTAYCKNCARKSRYKKSADAPEIVAAHEYDLWKGMNARCRDTDNKYYGGRGITVCDAWKSFRQFLNDMGPRPSPLHSIDRIDGNGNYEPKNCRWATAKEQARNMRNNVYLTVNGVSRLIQDWAAISGVKRATIVMRKRAGGWTDEEAIYTPPHRRRKKPQRRD